MKIINKIVNTVGYDKLLHMFLAGWVVSMASMFGWIAFYISILLIIVLSVAKEIKFDSKPDWEDVLFSMVGIFVSLIVFVFSEIFG